MVNFLFYMFCALVVSAPVLAKGNLPDRPISRKKIFAPLFEPEEFQAILIQHRQKTPPLALQNFLDAKKLVLPQSQEPVNQKKYKLLERKKQTPQIKRESPFKINKDNISTPDVFLSKRPLQGFDGNYVIGHIPGDGDCVLYSAGTTRLNFSHFLRENIRTPLVKKYVHQCMRDDLRQAPDGAYEFYEDPVGRKLVDLFKKITLLDRASIPFTEAQEVDYIDIVIAQNPITQSRRFTLIDRDFIQLLAIHVGKNIEAFRIEEDDDDFFEAAVLNYHDTIDQRIKEGMTASEAAAAVERPVPGGRRLISAAKSRTIFQESITILQTTNHCERLLKPDEVHSYMAHQVPLIIEKYKETEATTARMIELIEENIPAQYRSLPPHLLGPIRLATWWNLRKYPL